MSTSFKRAAFALLTTLFVSAMPLQAAYAEEPTAPATSCISFQTALSPEDETRVTEAGGTITRLEGVRSKAFISRIADMVGQTPPFEVGPTLLVKPDGDEDTIYNIAVFDNEGCLKAVLHFLPGIVEGLLSPNVFPQGERVD